MTNMLYIGPSIRGVVRYGSVFSGGIPARLEKLAEKKPIIKKLIVPVSEMEEAVRSSREEGSVIAVAYDRVSALSEAEIEEIMKEVKK